MSLELFDHIAQFVKEVGGPTAVSIGLMVILFQQTSILKGIRQTLERLHDAVVRAECPLIARKDSPSNDKADPKVYPGRPALGH